MLEYSSKLIGFDKLSDLLKDLPVNVEKRILQNATTSAIREAAKEIRKSAPSSEKNQQSKASRKYGKLKRNIKVMRLRRNEKGARSARVHTGDAFWGYFLEEGFTIEKGNRYVPAKPWFAPAFKRASERVIEKLAEKLSEGIYKEVNKLKK